MYLFSNISWFSSRAPLHQHEGTPWGSSPWWTCQRLPGSDRAPPLATRSSAPRLGGWAAKEGSVFPSNGTSHYRELAQLPARILVLFSLILVLVSLILVFTALCTIVEGKRSKPTRLTGGGPPRQKRGNGANR